MVLNESDVKNIIKKIISEVYNPWNAVTYKISVNILFAGFDECNLSFSLVFENDEDASKNMDDFVKQRLNKEFNNIVRYEIINATKASEKEQIRPMM